MKETKGRVRRKSAKATSANAASGPETANHKQSGGDPTFEQISTRAYEIFLERGGRHGDDLADWFRAERELRGETAISDQSGQDAG